MRDNGIVAKHRWTGNLLKTSLCFYSRLAVDRQAPLLAKFVFQTDADSAPISGQNFLTVTAELLVDLKIHQKIGHLQPFKTYSLQVSDITRTMTAKPKKEL